MVGRDDHQRTDGDGHAQDVGTIVLNSVTKAYGPVNAVENLSLTLGGGQYHCLLGPNGSGKSTVLRLVLGLTQPTSGSVEVPDISLGCGFQQPNFYPELTVSENIELFAGLVGADDQEYNERVVEELRLERALERRSGALSGGFRRKLDLALALLKQPDVLLLDEPLGALDDVSEARFLRFLDDFAGDGTTVVVATHRVTAFEPSVDRVSVLHRGSLVFDELAGNIDLAADESLQSYYVNTILEREGVE